MINTKKKQELITIIFLALAATSFAVAGWYFWRANGVPDAYNRSYEEWRNSGLPFGMPPDWDHFYGFMLAWQKAGVGFTFLGLAFSTLAFTCYKQTRKIAVMPITGRPGPTDVRIP